MHELHGGPAISGTLCQNIFESGLRLVAKAHADRRAIGAIVAREYEKVKDLPHDTENTTLYIHLQIEHILKVIEVPDARDG